MLFSPGFFLEDCDELKDFVLAGLLTDNKTLRSLSMFASFPSSTLSL